MLERDKEYSTKMRKINVGWKIMAGMERGDHCRGTSSMEFVCYVMLS